MPEALPKWASEEAAAPSLPKWAQDEQLPAWVKTDMATGGAGLGTPSFARERADAVPMTRMREQVLARQAGAAPVAAPAKPDPGTYVQEGLQGLARAPAGAVENIAAGIHEFSDPARAQAAQGVAEYKKGDLLRGTRDTVLGTLGEIFGPPIGGALAIGQGMDPGHVPETVHPPRAAEAVPKGDLFPPPPPGGGPGPSSFRTTIDINGNKKTVAGTYDPAATKHLPTVNVPIPDEAYWKTPSTPQWVQERFRAKEGETDLPQWARDEGVPKKPVEQMTLDELNAEVAKLFSEPAKAPALPTDLKTKPVLATETLAPGKAPTPAIPPDLKVVPKGKKPPAEPISVKDFHTSTADAPDIDTPLPKDWKSRMARAQKMGFDTSKTLYHATNKDFAQFELKYGKNGEHAVFASDDPEVVNANYGSGPGKRIIPMLAKFENPMEVDWPKKTGSGGYSNAWMQALIAEAKAGGHDAIIVKGIHDLGGKQTQYVFLKPQNLRAKYGAEFDPKKAGSAHLLSAAAPPTPPGGAAGWPGGKMPAWAQVPGQTKGGSPVGGAPPAGPQGHMVLGGPAAIPATPSRSFTTNLEDRLFKVRQSTTADKAEMGNLVKALPQEMKTPQMQEKMYLHMEDKAGGHLTPQEQQLYDKHVQPLKQEEFDLYDELKRKGIEEAELDPEYAHRIVKGRAPQFDTLGGEANPVLGIRTLPQSTSSLKARKFFALEDARGNRKVVSIDGDHMLVHEGGMPPTPVKPLLGPNDTELKPGATVSAGGKTWKLVQARTPEIELNTDTRYHKNAVANTIDNVVRLRKVARAVAEVQRLKDTPEWKAYARPHDAPAPAGWRVPKMPLFRDYKVDPHLANVLDDFYNSPGPVLERLQKINRLAVGSLFWNPIPHAANVGVHWTVANGWNWLNPKSLMMDVAIGGAKAVKEVVQQGPLYQKLLKEGNGLVYGGVANREFYETMMKRLGSDIEKNPKRWNPLIRTLGLNGPADLVKMLYDGSSRALWAANDVFMMMRVNQLVRQGRSVSEAIREAEKHIPNYRIPSQVLRSRTVSAALQNPVLTEFSRYHYGMLNSFGHMANDLVRGTGKERLSTLGNLMVLGALLYYVYPAIDSGIQKLTGNKDAKAYRRGAATVPQDLADMYNGDKDFIQVLQSLVTIAPVVKTAMETMANTDFFTGKRIAEPADMRAAAGGSLKAAGNVAAQEAGHIAGNLVAPYGQLDAAVRQKQSPGQFARDQLMGIKEPDPGAAQRKRAAFRTQTKQARGRHARPRDVIEELFGAAMK